jgi:hypothetical protein
LTEKLKKRGDQLYEVMRDLLRAYRRRESDDGR